MRRRARELVAFGVAAAAGFVIASAAPPADEPPAVVPAPSRVLPCPEPPRTREEAAEALEETRAAVDEARRFAVEIGALPTPWPEEGVPEDLRPAAFEARARAIYAEADGWHIDVLDCSEFPCVLAVSADQDDAPVPDIRPLVPYGYTSGFALDQRVYAPLVRTRPLSPDEERRVVVRIEAAMRARP